MWNVKSPSATFVTRSAIHNDAFISRLLALLAAMLDNSIYVPFLLRKYSPFSSILGVSPVLLPYLTERRRKEQGKGSQRLCHPRSFIPETFAALLWNTPSVSFFLRMRFFYSFFFFIFMLSFYQIFLLNYKDYFSKHFMNADSLHSKSYFINIINFFFFVLQMLIKSYCNL